MLRFQNVILCCLVNLAVSQKYPSYVHFPKYPEHSSQHSTHQTPFNYEIYQTPHQTSHMIQRYPEDDYYAYSDPYQRPKPPKKPSKRRRPYPFRKRPTIPPPLVPIEDPKILTTNPLLIIAIVGLPLLALLAFTAIIIPALPIVVYIIAAFGPYASVGRKRKKRSTLNWDLVETIFQQVTRALNEPFSKTINLN